ncbi:hypothetical protein KKE14_02455 [Patescibacteria group bacterium]|nr:hypothetical protein [Patescibacteria group bacterium]
MTRARNSEIATLIEWLTVGFATIIKMVRDGRRSEKDLGRLKAAMQAVIDDHCQFNKTWKTIKLGAHKSADDYLKALKEAGFRVGNWANDMIKKPAFKITNEPTDVELVLVTVAELGFPSGATQKDIYGKAPSMGLQLCPPEVGPALRLDYQDQPPIEYILIGMEPIADSYGGLKVFNVSHVGSDPWLDTYCADPDYHWSSVFRFVFVRRK